MSLEGAFEGVGEALSPLRPVLDFALPQYEAGGEDASAGSLISSFGEGIGDMIQEGPAGLFDAGRQALTGGGSARDRLLTGAMVAGGAAMTARGIHQRYKANRVAMPPAVRAAPVGGQQLVDLGDRPRYLTDTEPARSLARERPGTNARQIQMMAADDYDGVVRGFARFDLEDPTQLAAASSVFERYSTRIAEGAEGAQVDFARFDLAMDKGLFAYASNKRVRDMWKKVTNDPISIAESSEELDELFGAVRAFGDATNGVVADDLTVGLVGRISRVDFANDGVRIYTAHPIGWDNGRVVDPAVREARLMELNYRALVDQGKKNLRAVYNLGSEDTRRVLSGGRTIFNKKLELGEDWYPVALDDTVKAFAIDGDREAIDRAVAAVSFLSEAEDWSNNIVKARDALRIAGDVSDVDFQNYLRDGVNAVYGNKKTKFEYAGASSAEHSAKFDKIWADVKKAGFSVDKKTMQKVLRLYGGVESVQDVFRSTSGRKQKNFYLNIRYSDLDYPVTIDRHAFDAFLGLDSGVPDRPINMSLGDGDEVYDVIADAYRSVAEEMGLKPHQLQAVIWEAWREMKGASPRDGWTKNDPFMLPGDEPNLAYEALNGRGNLPGSLGSVGDPSVPVEVLQAKTVGDLMSAGNPDGTVVYAAEVTDRVATSARHLTPGVLGDDRVPRWIPSRARNVLDHQAFRREALADPLAHAETFLEIDMAAKGGHPLFRPENIITFELADGAKIKVPRGAGRAEDLGRSQVEGTKLSYEKLGPEGIDPRSFTDPARSPLTTNSYAAISPQLNAEQVGRLGASGYTLNGEQKRLYAELVKRDYKPIQQRGVYDGDSEPSFLVFGISPQEALELGEDFGQDSVITNKGLLYHRGSTMNPDNAGQFEPTGGVGFNEEDLQYGYSELVLGGETVRWTATDWAEPTSDFTAADLIERTSSSVRKVQLVLNEGQDPAAIASEIELRGAKNLSVYANSQSLEGFERAYETAVTDGTQMIVSRTANGSAASSNGGHVFVRSAGGLAKSSPSTPQVREIGPGLQSVGHSLTIDGRFDGRNVEFDGPFGVKLDGQRPTAWGFTENTLTPIFDEAVAASGRFDAIVKGKTISPADPADVTGALRARQELRDAGWPEELELKTDGGRLTFPSDKSFDTNPEVITTRNGLVVNRLRTDRPKTDWEADFGFRFDPGYRVGNDVFELEPGVQASLRTATELFMGTHADAVQRWRLPAISVTPGDPSNYAWLEWGDRAGGGIGLNKEWWGDQARFTRELTTDRDLGNLSSRLSAGPETILMHEYGHVLHGALRAGENFKKVSDAEKAIRDMVKKSGTGSWSRTAKTQISKTASMDIGELVAESVSEVLMSANPSQLASNVYDIVTDRLGTQLRFKKAINF